MTDLQVVFDQLQERTAITSKVQEALRACVDDVDSHVRFLTRELSSIHSANQKGRDLPEIGSKILASTEFGSLVNTLQNLANEASRHPMFKYNSIWTRIMQNSIFIVLTCRWLVHRVLASPEEIFEILQVPCEVATHTKSDEATPPDAKRPKVTTDKFYFSIEEYLHAAVSLSNELARLAVTSATSIALSPNEWTGEFASFPRTIESFVKDLQSSFMILNLKNDSLRRRFDSIKYDVRKVEEVVYDLSLRLPARP